MTVSDIRTLIKSVDPDAKHYYTTLDGESSYTVWAETERTGLEANNQLCELGWKFEIIRYTQSEFDEMPEKIEAALNEHPTIAYSYRVEADPESGYIMHMFDCEAS